MEYDPQDRALDLLDQVEKLNRETIALEQQALDLGQSLESIREQIAANQNNAAEMSAAAERLLAIAEKSRLPNEEPAPVEADQPLTYPGHVGAPGKIKKGGIPGGWSPGSTKL